MASGRKVSAFASVSSTWRLTAPGSSRNGCVVTWDFHPSPWSVGTWAVGHGAEPADGEVVCYAPPGTSVHGESGHSVVRWRRARWSHDVFFLAGEAPDDVEEVPFATVCADLSDELLDWAERETAAHIERLRAFARARPRAIRAAEAARDLYDDLSAARPEALEQYCLDADTATLEAEATEDLAREPRRDVIRLRAMSLLDWLHVARQVTLLAVAYAAYRTVRPADVAANALNPPIHAILSLPLREVLVLLYGALHVPLTGAFLAWLYFRRNSAFGFVRNALVVAMLVAVPAYLLSLSPVAYAGIVRPEPEHWVPTLAVPTMPALHLAVALIIGFSGVMLFRPLSLRLVSAVYPLAVIAVVAVTAPRWPFLTLGGAIVTTVAAWAVAGRIGRRVTTSRQPPRLAMRRRLGPRDPGAEAACVPSRR